MFSNSKENSFDSVLWYLQSREVDPVTFPSNIDWFKGCHFPYHKNAVKIGRFAFQVHCHDTGNSVTGYILNDGKPYEIIHATFWNRSGYEHNKDKWESGKWNEALNKAIDDLTSIVVSCKQQEAIQSDILKKKAISEQQADKERIESLFE